MTECDCPTCKAIARRKREAVIEGLEKAFRSPAHGETTVEHESIEDLLERIGDDH